MTEAKNANSAEPKAEDANAKANRPSVNTQVRRASIPFRAKLTVIGALLAVVPIAVVGYALLDVNKHAVTTMSKEFRLAVANDLARTIEGELQEAQDGLDAVGKILTNADIAADSTEQLANSLVGSNEALDHVGVYGLDGHLIDVFREAVAAGARIRPPEQLSDRLREEASRENVATGDAVPGAAAPRVLLIAPLRVGDDVSGFVGSLVSLEDVQLRVERLSEDRFGASETVDWPPPLMVVDNRLRIVAHPDPELAGALTSTSGQGILEGVDAGALANRSLQTSGEAIYDGQEVVGTLITLQTLPWGVIAQIPRRHAYASFYTMRNIVIATIIVAILLALLVAFLAAKQITRPIQELSSFANDLAARRFDRRVTLTTRDEFGVLSDVMSAAAADLQASEERIAAEVAIRSDLGRYLPADLVDKVVKREQDMGLGGARREISVLFADVVAFTPISDKLSAEEVVSLLNEFFTILTEIVFRHGGTIDKFIGDCVMAIFGAPTPLEDHAERALLAADDMMRWLEAGNLGWKEKYGVTIEIAIGVNTGDAVVGNVGSETRMEYTAIGDTVNVAARLESIARPSQILASKAVVESVDASRFDFVELGPRQMSGRAEPVHIFEVRV